MQGGIKAPTGLDRAQRRKLKQLQQRTEIDKQSLQENATVVDAPVVEGTSSTSGADYSNAKGFTAPSGLIRLTKLLSLKRLCSRRNANSLVKKGLVFVDGVNSAEKGPG